MSSLQTPHERKRERVKQYLLDRAEREGEFYIKSKFIADDVDCSTKELGTILNRFSESLGELEVEPWAYTNATTWRVSPE